MIIVGIIITLLVILIDQLLKLVAIKKFKDNSEKCILGDHIIFTYLENEGAMLGIFSKHKIVIYIASIVAIVLTIILLFIPLYTRASFNFTHAFTSVFLGGAIGNFTDRIIRGKVIDFVYFRIGKHRSAVFNFADGCIFIGVIGILVGVIIYGI